LVKLGASTLTFNATIITKATRSSRKARCARLDRIADQQPANHFQQQRHARCFRSQRRHADFVEWEISHRQRNSAWQCHRRERFNHAPGFSIGTLVVTNTLPSIRQHECDAVGQVCAHERLITGMVSVTYGGRLVLTNLTGSLTNGGQFQSFNAGSYSNAFSSIAWPALSGNLV